MVSFEATRAWAAELHAGQVDKAGEPYIGHVERVVGHLVRLFPDPTEIEIHAAWLHDVIEDCGVIPQEIVERGYPLSVALIVGALSRPEGVSYNAWIDEIAEGGVESVIRIKLADLCDNTDPDRLAKLSPADRKRLSRKYGSAIHTLLRALPPTSDTA